MSHPQQMFFVGSVRNAFPEFFQGRRVLEVGSLDINGSVRQFFSGCEYLGIDIGQGRGVDMVCRGEDLGAPAATFDVVISCEMMEHNERWRETWLNMLRMVKPDGLLIMSCASRGRRRHGTPDFDPHTSPLTVGQGKNYYQNLVADDFRDFVDCDQWFSVWDFFNDETFHDLYFFGVGRQADDALQARGEQLRDGLTDHYWKKNIGGIY